MPMPLPGTFRGTLLVALASLLLVATAACTSASTTSDAEAPTGTTITPTATPISADVQARAQSYLLTLEDLPEGWIESTPAPDKPFPDDYPGDIPPECDFFVADNYVLDGTLTEVESNDFGGPNAESVSSDVTIMESRQAAADGFEFVRRAYHDCDKFYQDAFKFVMEREMANGVEESGDDNLTIEVLDLALDIRPFPAHGDDTLATRVTLLVRRNSVLIKTTIDSVAIRVGDTISNVEIITYLTPDDDLQKQLAGRVEELLLAPHSQ